jgi:hypothetical protein
MDNPLADYTTDSDSEEEDDKVAFHCGFAVGLCISVYSSRFDKQPVHTSMLSGQQWLDEIQGRPRPREDVFCHQDTANAHRIHTASPGEGVRRVIARVFVLHV